VVFPIITGHSSMVSGDKFNSDTALVMVGMVRLLVIAEEQIKLVPVSRDRSIEIGPEHQRLTRHFVQNGNSFLSFLAPG
jgi:hypothetical protein